MDLKLELVLIPVTDVDRGKAFYTEKVGFNLDVDTSPMENFRVVQVTPPGSACSVGFGVGITDAPPGSTAGMHLVVTDIEAARAELVDRGVKIAEVRHVKDGEWTQGVDPAHTDYTLSSTSTTQTGIRGSCRRSGGTLSKAIGLSM